MEILVIAAIALLIVGPKRLPEVGRTIGRSLREFKKAQEDFTRSFNLDGDDHNQPPAFPESEPAGAPETSEAVERSPDSEGPDNPTASEPD